MAKGELDESKVVEGFRRTVLKAPGFPVIEACMMT
jgi:hypothetical protein